MKMLVKSVEVKFNTQGCSRMDIEKKMYDIEEKFSKNTSKTFRTILKSYVNLDGHSKIRFQFDDREGIPVGDVFKIFEEWQSIVKINYSVILHNITVSMI